MPRPRILVVDDIHANRVAMRRLLAQVDAEIVEAASGAEALAACLETQFALILLDVQMPKMNGLAVQKALNERGCEMPVIVLTGHGDVSVAVQAMKAGAVNFVEKPYEKQVLLQAINEGFEHLDSLHQGALQKTEAEKRLSHLSPRERDILNGLVEGLTNKGIANSLDISPRTVEIHRANMMDKLGVDSLSAALRIAFAAARTRWPAR